MPTTPQNDAGWRTDPPVSEPSAAGTAPAATSAAEPPDEPPGTRVLSNGWSERPYAECSVDEPMPNSSQFVFPAISAPAAFSFVTAVASYGERYASRIFEPQLVVNSRVQMLSFTATGMPYNTPEGCAVDAWTTSDLRSSLIGVRQAFSRLTLTMRSAAALALASASLGSITLRRPRTARAWAPGRSRLGRQGRGRQVRTRGARASLRRGGTAPHPGPARTASRPHSPVPR